MTLFVVVRRNNTTGNEYITDSSGDGFMEYSDAERMKRVEEDADGDLFAFYVGRVEKVEET